MHIHKIIAIRCCPSIAVHRHCPLSLPVPAAYRRCTSSPLVVTAHHRCEPSLPVVTVCCYRASSLPAIAVRRCCMSSLLAIAASRYCLPLPRVVAAHHHRHHRCWSVVSCCQSVRHCRHRPVGCGLVIIVRVDLSDTTVEHRRGGGVSKRKKERSSPLGKGELRGRGHEGDGH